MLPTTLNLGSRAGNLLINYGPFRRAETFMDKNGSFPEHDAVEDRLRAGKAIEFYKEAFGASEIMSMPWPDGRVMHAEIKIGDSAIMIGDECPEMNALGPLSRGGATSSLMVPPDAKLGLSESQGSGH